MQSEFPEIGDVRQIGLHIGIEFIRDPETREPIPDETGKIRDVGIRHGIIFGLGGVRRNVLKIKPPLIINRQEADEVVELLRTSRQAVLRRQAVSVS